MSRPLATGGFIWEPFSLVEPDPVETVVPLRSARTVDLTGLVSSIGIELTPWQHQTLANLPTGKIRLSTWWSFAGDDWLLAELIFAHRARVADLRRARLSRMRTMYRARHR